VVVPTRLAEFARSSRACSVARPPTDRPTGRRTIPAGSRFHAAPRTSVKTVSGPSVRRTLQLLNIAAAQATCRARAPRVVPVHAARSCAHRCRRRRREFFSARRRNEASDAAATTGCARQHAQRRRRRPGMAVAPPRSHHLIIRLQGLAPPAAADSQNDSAQERALT